jgi:hypothetical protein
MQLHNNSRIEQIEPQQPEAQPSEPEPQPKPYPHDNLIRT